MFLTLFKTILKRHEIIIQAFQKLLKGIVILVYLNFCFSSDKRLTLYLFKNRNVTNRNDLVILT